ncbi:DUF1800 domain-containing protein [Rhodanobacter sp. AS-Z3]|uniref:DUF1800 domain-containing protein n=1 Tax=Rhodanobacter sp. AS-Z3 TaxID=3031330 RepID=UPI00247ADB9A|nr:DUF1800 domain-containing protein [Rhodanobacter sp. AS-Z3]WEN16746.1 DUF1800 domain-containing protein [Rhodanobacter sp. AS-Z3]
MNPASTQPKRLRSPRLILLTAGLLLACAASAQPAVTPTPAPGSTDVRWLQRATFGIDSASLASYRQLGRQRWLDAQLADHDDTLPPAISALIASYPAVSTPPEELLDKEAEARRQLKAMPDGDAKVAAKKDLQKQSRELAQQAQQAELLHAIYGSNPLKEQIVWFWLNHFSVYAAKGRVRLVAADYEEHVIRPHALGKFRDLLLATLKSPAMLEFLDNAKNVKGKTNENYARELMELHTLGVGSGYTQQDVQQLALILTGAGIAPKTPRRFERAGRGRFGHQQAAVMREGLFVFNPQKHDFSDKVLFGQRIRGRGYEEIEQALQLITRQPACAQFVSRQLAEYFVADQPPPTLVDAMAKTFKQTDGDIAAVLRTMFDSPELLADNAKKFKDPTQFLVSAMKLTYDGQPISNAQPLVNWLNQMGEPVFGRITPDGWPVDGASWSGSGQMASRFEVARAIGSGRNKLFMVDSPENAAADTPRQRPIAPAMDTALYHAVIEPYLSESAKVALGKAATVAEWNTYLLSSPDFNYR